VALEIGCVHAEICQSNTAIPREFGDSWRVW
jgi:hypothetical protein